MNPQDFDSATSFPAADIKAEIDGRDMKINHSYRIVTPDKEKNDFLVPVRASALNVWREKLDALKATSFPWGEVLLAISSLGVGAIFSALLSDVALNTDKGKLFFIALPPLAVAALVAYIFVRSIETSSASSVAEALLRDMPSMDEFGDQDK